MSVLAKCIVSTSFSTWASSRFCWAHLITIPPEEVLRANVLVLELGLLLLGLLVRLVLPMLVPESVSIRRGDDHAWRDDAVRDMSVPLFQDRNGKDWE